MDLSLRILQRTMARSSYFRDCVCRTFVVVVVLVIQCLVGAMQIQGDKDLKTGTSPDLKYVWGDALSEPGVLGPDGKPYPWDAASKIAGRQRIPRSLFGEDPVPLMSPEDTRKALLFAFEAHHFDHEVSDSFLMRNSGPGLNRKGRKGRSEKNTESSSTSPTSGSSKGSATISTNPNSGSRDGCVPTRLCETTYNTTAPLYGVSLTSGQPVTIVQKFPDLLQQVVYQVCKTEECDVIQGQCVQTYLPYLFLVIPLGPVTLTGQDYVLVESGCTCKPKYARRIEEPPPLPFIQPFNTSKPRNNKRF